MELEYLLSNLDKPSKLIQKIKSAKPEIDAEAVALFDIDNHDVMQVSKRPQREVRRTLYHEDGSAQLDDLGNKKTEKVYIDVNRIPLPVQKFIVEQRMNMLLADQMELDATPKNEVEENLITSLRKAWEKNKVYYDLKEIFIRQMSECEVAVLLSVEDAEDGYWDGTPMEGVKKKIRLNILTSEGGNSLFPVYNQYKDMVSFCREYKIKDDETDKETTHFDFFTPKNNYYTKQGAGSWEESMQSESNIDGKIPAVYFPQKKVEWADQQISIDRKEALGSNHAEANNRTAFPITLLTAETIESMPQADDAGKVIQLTGKDADAKYLESSGAPESIKMEYEKLDANIDKHSGTIDFNTLHNFFGSAPSGYAIKLLFQPAHMKAAQKIGDYGKGIQRLINLYKSILCGLNDKLKIARNMNVEPSFNLYLPKNENEELDVIIKARAAGLISDETAVMKCPIIKDTAAEWIKIKKQKEAAPIAITDDKSKMKIA